MGNINNELRRLAYYESKLIDNRELIEDDQYRFIFKMKLNALESLKRYKCVLSHNNRKLLTYSVDEFCMNVKKALTPYIWEDEAKTCPPY